MVGTAVALLRAIGIEDRWKRRRRFVILISGAQALNACVGAWRLWRDDPERCERLDVIAVGCESMASTSTPSDGDAETRALQAQLQAALPPLTPNLHRIAFEAGRVQLLICPADVPTALRHIVATVDAFVIDAGEIGGVDLLSREPRVAKSIGRLASPDALLVMARSTAKGISALVSVGFAIESIDDGVTPGLRAHYRPRFAARRPAARTAHSEVSERTAVIVGAGLAGCATAWALAEQGWRSTLLERGPSIAGDASGNPAGLFHGVVNGHDGAHARFHRAAALEAHAAAAIAIRAHRARGSIDGLLQLVAAERSPDDMRALLHRLDLPAGYVQALAPAEAAARAGMRVDRPAWFYPRGGWIAPRELARSFIERAGPQGAVRTGIAITALRRLGERWELLDAGGRCIETAAAVVLANAGDAFRLLGGSWPVEPVRGQISLLAVDRSASLRLPRLPITGAGYLLPEVDGRAIFGATSNPGDDRTDVRRGDHCRNWVQLARLVPDCGAAVLDCPPDLDGRAGVRWVSRDRLPLIGAVPLLAEGQDSSHRGRSARMDQPRFVARQPGLFVLSALGSRGITTAALGAQVLAALLTGGPSPIEADLLDAVDPARFWVRDRRRSPVG